MTKRITDLIQAVSDRIPQQIAIYIDNGTYTYADLWTDVENKVAYLHSKDVQAGMGVGVMGQNSIDFITSMLAVMHLGAIALPVSHNLKPAEIDKLAKRTRLHFFWDDKSASLPTSLNQLAEEGAWRWSENESGKENLPLVENVPEAALIRFTSGTTGKSKGVVLSHQSIIERTSAANEVLRLNESDTVIWVLSMAYHFVVSILLYLRYGCGICICENFMGDYILDRTKSLGGTFLYLSPMHVRMLNSLPKGVSMPSVKWVVSTSMAIDGKLCQAFQEKFQRPITQAFGIIEIGLPVINHRKPGSNPQAIGHPLPAYEVKILNEKGHEMNVSEVGQLGIIGPGMFDAYLDPPMMRSQALDHGYFLTGDLATVDDNGRITIVGRKKNVINVSGNKAFPEEIENVINRFPGVAMSRVRGFEHPLLKECVMADVVRKEGETVEVEELIAYCRKRLSTYKVPQRINFVAELAMTDSGKMSRV